ncbi:glutamyl-tRNA reductase [Lutimonas saemankumensis]|uniref:glutamyl-tRNA reductase n=1 Tax=Lutimonas saemankumensis TaxID=483016 RepID=UPI001CD75DE8|nr:glutamyl-tRNA reductase [Lutimonas saemankumensis]MCA0931180.1 glutamyl-tRNA reductase [Lutimonas saemankumensis]
MTKNSDCKKFYVIGLNYKKADVVTRSNFSLSKEKQKELLEEAKRINIKSVVILSTCNRIEIIGFAKHPFQLISLLCKYSKGTMEEFAKVSYVYKNSEASEHIIRIATGIDSQILGDYEIVGQLKEAFYLAKEAGTVNAYLERLFNVSLAASKETKNKTSISSGTTTVSYAAVKYIKDNFSKKDPKKILVYGLGDIGQNTAKSCAEYLNAHSLTLVNRTEEKAIKIANEINAEMAAHKDLGTKIKESDIVIVATGASTPTVTADMIHKKKEQLIIDLSIPRNADPVINDSDNISMIDVDVLSKKTKETIEERKKQIPLVEDIIQKHKSEFYEWLNFRRSTPAINSLKKSLELIQKDAITSHSKKYQDINSQLVEDVTSQMINKIVSKFAMHLKAENTQANRSIKVMNDVFNLEPSEN